ncbi:MAG: hypothetical protein HOV77_08070 [Hamadaea sp.]|uniref:hypothetical protein n=1 Tax=Hamadaea sp. TaxID=2024425 RepID=UPI0017E9D111|nr:hypothetical protein [Hamadaea sp.]NUT19128.1 hypothetical protein [Hamadaea sp.]
MGHWFDHEIIRTGRLPLFCFFAGVVIGFAFIRISVRLIRAQVRWWPGNVTPGGLHIHHVVFGVVFMLIGGVAALAIPRGHVAALSAVAALFGVGAALVLDEFALILHLDDVYWTEQGRTSVDAVFVAVAVSGMLLLGLRPVAVEEFLGARSEGGGWVNWAVAVAGTLVNLTLAAITLLKGKIWTGLAGLFIPVLLYVGALRLARPGSPWARWRYVADTPRARAKLAKAEWRERRIRRPLIRAKIWLQELVAGRFEP